MTTHAASASDSHDDALSMLAPDFPFSFDRYVAHPDGLGTVPQAARGTEVAVVGAGLAGIVTAYELMRLGLKPVIYEAGRIGGRLRSEPVEGVEDMVVELGAMRFPPTGRTFWHYMDLAGVETRPFPNPLTTAAPGTVIELAGQAHYTRDGSDLPPIFGEVGKAWAEALEEGARFSEMQAALRARDTDAIKAIWNDILPDLDRQSFYGFLAGTEAFQSRSFRHLEVFGQVGFGSGGWDTDFPNSMLEILRVIYTGADDGHRSVVGGVEQVPRAIWRHAPDDIAHWPKGTTLEELHGGTTRGAVAAIRRAGDGFAVTDRWGNARTFPAVVVTCQTWLLSTVIDCDETLFSQQMWMAMERTHYMQSSKTFIVVDRPFWRDRDPDTGREMMSMTLSDRKTRGTYLLDDGTDEGPAAICLSYTWNDDAMKWITLPVKQRTELMIDSLEKIYPRLDIRAHIVGDPITVSWEDDPHFMGAFKGNLPGHYRYQRRLYGHFMQGDLPRRQRGIFLAGDSISWMAGWAEGAATTALNAVWGVLDHFGGTTHADNPGPGDLWAEIGPLDLPD